MEPRASVKEIVEYAEEFTKRILSDVPNKYFQQSVVLNPLGNFYTVSSVLRKVKSDLSSKKIPVLCPSKSSACKSPADSSNYSEAPDFIKEIEERTGKSLNEVTYCDTLCYLREAEEKLKQFLKDNPPTVGGCKQLLRNSLLNLGASVHRGMDEAYTVVYTDLQPLSEWHLKAEIYFKDAKFSAKVFMGKDRCNCTETLVIDELLYEIPELKLTKFLKKLGMSEQYVTKVATILPNKPRKYSIHFLDQYIPEVYQIMEKQGKCKSCMSKNSNHFGLPDHEHPLLAYEGDTDFYLAIIRDEESKDDFPYVARSIVCKKEEEWGYKTVYGLEVTKDLSYFGLESDIDMQDAKLSLIYSDTGDILAPYVDGTECRFYIENNNIYVDDFGERKSNYETGRLGGIEYCEYCDEYHDEVYPVNNGSNNVCENCRDEHFYYVRSREEYYSFARVEMADGEYYHEDDVVYSEYYSEYIPEDMAWYSKRGETWLRHDDNEDECFPQDD